jgi:O-antigen/teichoic acid export membrane protein
MLCWSAIGMSAIFELGIGRAVTHFTGKQQSQGSPAELGAAWTFLWMLGALVSVAALIGSLALQVLQNQSGVSVAAWSLLLATVPLGVLTAGYRGVIEGALQFGGAAVLRALTVVALMALPWLFGIQYASVEAVGLGFLVARLGVLGCHHAYERRSVGMVRQVRRAATRQAYLRVGGFIASLAVATSIGTFLGYLDRLVLASGSAVQSFADYLVPFELVSRVGIIPAAVSSVLFAVVSSAKHSEELKARASQSHYTVGLFIIPVTVLCCLFAGPILETWMGVAPTLTSVRIMQVLAVGVAFNSIAQVALASAQAAGGERQIMWIYVAELPLTLLLTWWAFDEYGMTGLAIAWSGRCIIDCVALVVLQRRIHELRAA